MYRPKTSDIWPPRYGLGMWAWLFQRISGLVLALYLIGHIWVISFSIAGQGGIRFDSVLETLQKPYVLALELLLFWAVLYHGLNGLRVILIDFGLGIREQHILFWTAMAVALALLSWGIIEAWPYITGTPLI
ncbi:MAG: succinate dehydrogenase, cytochrome b556 subunit [Chloroflexi bacterium]|nr:succinate dehydrogenase, cytochrome b556 subunit [Chloroflexota bacterium]